MRCARAMLLLVAMIWCAATAAEAQQFTELIYQVGLPNAAGE